jgi:hypothetical protein
VWGQVSALRSGRPIDWAIYAGATVALLWTHYFAILQVFVQQAAFLVVFLRDHRRGRPVLVHARRWAFATGAIMLLLLPLLPILSDQISGYMQRGSLFQDTPPRAGGSLEPAQEQLSVYAILANIVWAIWGYHSDGAMVQIVAFWPLLMLGALFLFGRGRPASSTLLIAVVVGPLTALFALGLVHRDVFELRYFAGSVPALLLLLSALIASAFHSARTRAVAVAIVVASLAGGLVDQQVNGANPRIYDFRGALGDVSAMAGPNDVVLYEPHFLEPVMDYYVPDLHARSGGSDPLARAEGHWQVFVVGSFLDRRDASGRTGWILSELDESRRLVAEYEYPRIKVWVFR